MNDVISRQAAIDALRDWEMCYDWDEHCREEPKEPWVVSPSDVVNKLPPIQPEPQEIGYDDCANALLKMWMDNVLTDGDYYRIADKLNEKCGKTELPEPYKGVTE